MIKKLFFFFLLILIVAAAVVYFFGSGFLNKQIRQGVEKYGPEVTQTPVTLESVNLSVLSGNGTLKGLKIGNPEGYESENIFALGEITVDLDPKSLLSDTIIINKIHIIQPEVSYEKTLRNSNVKDLLKNIEEFTGPSNDSAEEDSGPSKQVVIKQLIVDEGKIYVGALGVGQTIPLTRIEMNNIGENGKTVSMAEIMDIVLSQVMNSIGPSIANAGALLEEGGKAAIDTVKKEALDGATDAVNKGLKSIFGE